MNERSKEMRERLAAVEKELAELKKQRKTLQRDYPKDVPEEWADPKRNPKAPEAAPAQGRAETPAAPAGTRSEAPDWAVSPEDESRERFANYFMTGSLGRSGPQLRREKRAMRNKAIVAAIAALLLLIALVRFLVK